MSEPLLSVKNMKKKLLIAATILTLAIIASLEINLNIGKKTTAISLKNIEAVALGEGSTTKKYPLKGRPIGSGMWQYYCADEKDYGCSE